MRVPILTAVVDARWESGLVSAFERGEHGVVVVRRCVDLADLLAVAASGTARAVLLSADLRRLDRDALARLGLAGLAVVGLVPPGDEHADRRLRQLGVGWVLPADAAPEVIAQAVTEAVAARVDGVPVRGYAQPLSALPAEPPPGPVVPELMPGTGRVVAVWGPTGAPGRTTVAVNLAAELAEAGSETLLVDADVYDGTVAQHLGLVEEAPGVAAACRLAGAGTLDVPGLAGLARELGPRLRVLTGIARPDRWPELRPAAVEAVLATARHLGAFVVVDCGFCLEQDEELSYDTAAPRRNGATLTVLDQADTLLAVVGSDPVGLARAIRGVGELREAAGVEPLVVVNRLRRPPGRPARGDPEREVRSVLARYVGAERVVALPDDPTAVDRAVRLGRTLAEAAPRSVLRQAVAALATDLAGAPATRGARRRRTGRLAALVGR